MSCVSRMEQIRELKKKILDMQRERSARRGQNTQDPSPIWLECVKVLSFAANLSEEDYRNLRLHTELITGVSPFAFWHADPSINPEQYARQEKYFQLVEGIPERFWLSEPPTPQIPRPMGIVFRNKIINSDITRYQICVSNLYTLGILNQLLKSTRKGLVLEIGGGYGGLANGLGNILGQACTYILLDLPEMLHFSGGFLIVNNPGKKIYVYAPETFTSEFLRKGIYDYDFVLLPNYVLSGLRGLAEIDLLINMESFQEMTLEQLREYLEFGAEKTRFLFSDNLERHPFNPGLSNTSISRELARLYHMIPEPAFYESRAASKGPWYYRQYICIPKRITQVTFPKETHLRLVGGNEYSRINV